MERMKITPPEEIPFEDLVITDEERKEVLSFYYDHVHIYYQDIYRWIISRAPKLEPEYAEEIHQETILRALENRHQLRDIDSCKTWLFSIAKNEINGHYRTLKKQEQMMNADFSYGLFQVYSSHCHEEVDTTLDAILKKCEAELLKECLEELDENQRKVLALRHYGEMKFKEIAEYLNENEDLVYSWYRRGCKRMKRLVRKKGGLRNE